MEDSRAQKAFQTQVSLHPHRRLGCADRSPARIAGFLEKHPDHLELLEAEKSEAPLRAVSQGGEHGVWESALRVAPGISPSSTGTRQRFILQGNEQHCQDRKENM